MDPQRENAIRRSIGAPEIATHPGQQEQNSLPTGPSTEMRENRSQAETTKQKTAGIPPAVGIADDPDLITPAEARTPWKLPEVDKQSAFEVPTLGETGRSAVGGASTNGTAPRLPVHKAASEPELGSINKKTNVGPGRDMTAKQPGIVVIFPEPPKDDPEKSVKETESKRKVAQAIAA
ncbi:hypothetical protein H9Q69_001771 [Fusarium xylarioides]|uniref:Uncharacterized protein n=1 Tax=Fusarium xylarioides TaxID=221167 RepID=A0A9P7HP92_9HYPO|nr:hypothetical protein H9Q70_005161 [Fusarium xylarioides]KAG5763284.1 hypothetical protein H9Q72_008604 [Fusarium xylarioides]KAG5778207.1 hypothetical protein H9Q73_008145 [Fusarium xylarioides]KAG5799239.1 hypothetical protein H9Q69_001771 [Fusarium xylarioides]KAG5805837.1 hypothetical protein H9Q71_009586 [Fusarium xylarioides]